MRLYKSYKRPTETESNEKKSHTARTNMLWGPQNQILSNCNETNDNHGQSKIALNSREQSGCAIEWSGGR